MKITSAILMILMSLTLTYASSGDNRTTDHMVLVKGGCYQMGDIFRDVPSSEKPVHEVCVADFYVGKYEVTVGEFREFVNETGYKTDAERQDGCHSWTGDGELVKVKDHSWRKTGFPQTERDPVVCISWNDADKYIQWLNRKGYGNFRLLTEAEWEYAARSGGKEYQYSWGDGPPSGNVADESAKEKFPALEIWEGYRDGYAYTAPVGSFRPNDLGLYDMSGNAYEWVADWQGDNYYAGSPRDNPKGPDTGKYKIIRGGAWDLQPDTARTANRYWNESGGRAVCIGFRLARTGK
ncbi:MAG: formylglycine-generating enzyme family protein [Nitrospirota bacterium]